MTRARCRRCSRELDHNDADAWYAVRPASRLNPFWCEGDPDGKKGGHIPELGTETLPTLTVRVGNGGRAHAMVFQGDPDVARDWAARNARTRTSVAVCGRTGATPTGLTFDVNAPNACKSCIERLAGF